MTGDDRARHCGDCDLDVFNLSGMTRREAQKLILAKSGHLCVRFFLRHDGTVLTQDCPTGLARIRRRFALVAGALLSLLGFSGVVAAAGARTLTCHTTSSSSSGFFAQSPTVQSILAVFSGQTVAPVINPPQQSYQGKMMMGTPIHIPTPPPPNPSGTP